MASCKFGTEIILIQPLSCYTNHYLRYLMHTEPTNLSLGPSLLLYFDFKKSLMWLYYYY
jgi:hypothetical protein